MHVVAAVTMRSGCSPVVPKGYVVTVIVREVFSYRAVEGKEEVSSRASPSSVLSIIM